MQNDWKQSIELQTEHGIHTIDLTVIQKAELRVSEVAYVNPQTAPELLSTFNVAFLDLVSVIGKMELEYRRAQRKADQVKSVIVLDKARDILKAKGLVKDSAPAGSADLRDAVLDGDNEYQDALDKIAEVDAIVNLLKGKARGIEMAYNAVKKVMGETYVPNSRENRTNGIMPDYESGQDSGHQVVTTKSTTVPGRYGYTKPVL